MLENRTDLSLLQNSTGRCFRVDIVIQFYALMAAERPARPITIMQSLAGKIFLMVLLNRQEAAALLGLEPQTLAVWSMTGKNLPVIRIGSRTVRYDSADVLTFIEKCKTATSRRNNDNSTINTELGGNSYE